MDGAMAPPRAQLHPAGWRALRRACVLGRAHSRTAAPTPGSDRPTVAARARVHAASAEAAVADHSGGGGQALLGADQRWPPGGLEAPGSAGGWQGAVAEAFSGTAFARALQLGNLREASAQLAQLLAALQRFEASLGGLREAAAQGTAAALSPAGREWFAAAILGQYRAFVRLCLQQRRLESALDLARSFPPNGALFTGLLRECLEHGDLHAVTRAIKARKAAGLAEDGFCYTALLMAAARENQAARLEAVLQAAWAGGARDPAHFNVVIGHHNQQRDCKAAFATYERMLGLGLEPDVVTMNLLIEAAGRAGRPGTARQLYGQMRALGPAPASRTFVHLFQAAGRARERDAEWLMELFADMRADGIQPITQHWVTFLVACGEAPLTGAQIRDTAAAALAHCLAAGGDCSVTAALLKFCSLQGIPEHAAVVWRAIRKDKHQLDTWVFAALFTACAANSCPELKVVVTEAAAELDRAWLQARRGAARSAHAQRGWTVAYNALLNACAKMGTMAAARQVCGAMQAQGPPADIITYNTLLAGHAQAADTSAAFQVFYELCESSARPQPAAFKLRPNERTFGALLHACARQGNADSAKRVVELMARAGVPPTAVTTTSLMHAHVNQGSPENVEFAFQAFEGMKRAGLAPTAVTYGCLMHACELAGRADRAVALYREACERGVLPTDACHNILVSTFARSGRLEEEVGVLEGLAGQRGVKFQAGALNSLVRALAPDHVGRALRLLARMRRRGLRPHRETLTVLITACSRASLIDTAHTLYWELRSIGVGATREAGSHLIMALCQARQTDLALRVFEDMVVATRADGAAESPAPAEPATTPAGASGSGTDAGARLSAADLLGIRRRIVHDAGGGGGGPAEAAANTKRPQRRRRAVFPHARAMAALVQAFTLTGDLDTAFRLYRQLQCDSVGAAAVTLSDRYMWQALIEVACRQQQLPLALEVFDDWKSYCAAQSAMHRFDAEPGRFVPRLSKATLAFLEACCRASPGAEWRVFDVCAAMRQQEERRRQAELPRPAKPSHHFAEAGEAGAERPAAPQPAELAA